MLRFWRKRNVDDRVRVEIVANNTARRMFLKRHDKLEVLIGKYPVIEIRGLDSRSVMVKVVHQEWAVDTRFTEARDG